VDDAGVGEPLAVANAERDVGAGLGRDADLVGPATCSRTASQWAAIDS